jgi:hypothetical protein
MVPSILSDITVPRITLRVPRSPVFSMVLLVMMGSLTGLLATDSDLALAQNRFHAGDVATDKTNLGRASITLGELAKVHFEKLFFKVCEIEKISSFSLPRTSFTFMLNLSRCACEKSCGRAWAFCEPRD